MIGIQRFSKEPELLQAVYPPPVITVHCDWYACPLPIDPITLEEVFGLWRMLTGAQTPPWTAQPAA